MFLQNTSILVVINFYDVKINISDTLQVIPDCIEGNFDKTPYPQIFVFKSLEEEDLRDTGEEELLDSTLSLSKTAQHEDFLHEFSEGDLNPRSFAGSQVVIFDVEKKQAELLSQYLTERSGMEVDCVSKRQNLWRMGI